MSHCQANARFLPPRTFRFWIAASILIFAGSLSAQDAAQGPPKPQPDAPAAEAPPAERYWESQWEFEEIDIGKLAERLDSIGIEIGFKLEGKVTVKFDVGIPLTSLSDGAAYRFDGQLTSPRLVADRIELKDLETSINYRNGLATLTQLKCSVVDAENNSPEQSQGELAGKGTLQLSPQGDATAELEVDDLTIAPISGLIAKFFPTLEKSLPNDGKVSGDLRFRTPIESLYEISTYQLDGQFRAANFQVGNLPPANVEIGKIQIRDGRLGITGIDLKAESNNAARTEVHLMGQADFPLTNAGQFSFEVITDDLPVEELNGIFSVENQSAQRGIVEGKVDFRLEGTGELTGKTESLKWNIEGSVASPSFTIGGVELGTIEHNLRFTPTTFELLPRRRNAALPERFKIRSIQAEYQLLEDAFELTSLDAKLFGGQISGTATLPRQDDGDVVVNLAFSEVRPEMRLSITPTVSPKIAATFAGDVDWRVPINQFSEPIAHQGSANLTASRVMVGSEPVGELTTQVLADNGDVNLQVEGEIFGGRIQGKTAANLFANDRWGDLPQRLNLSQLELDGVSLSPLVDLLANRRVGFSAKASGRVAVDFESQRATSSLIPDTAIELELSQINHGARLLSRNTRLEGRITKDVLEIQSLVGDFADGSVRLNGRVYLLDSTNAFHPRADARLVATRVKLDQGLWFIGDSAEKLQGRVSVKATIAGYQESVRVRGSISGRELAANDIPIGIAHSSLAASANLESLRWDLNLPTVRSRVGGGQLEGELFLASGRTSGFDLTSRWKTRRVDFFRLTNQLGRSSSLARGEISGEITLGGKSVETIDDLAGRFRFKLGQTRGAAVPGLLAASQWLGPVSLATQSFDVGEAKGIIGQGVIVVDEFWLGSDNVLVQADGKVYLRSGRMDLNALIATGDYSDIAANFSQLAQQYALRALLPASAILSVSELLCDRTLVIAVLGTTQNPIVRLRPVETFREEAARFLLREGQRLILAGLTAEAADGIDGGF